MFAALGSALGRYMLSLLCSGGFLLGKDLGIPRAFLCHFHGLRFRGDSCMYGCPFGRKRANIC